MRYQSLIAMSANAPAAGASVLEDDFEDGSQAAFWTNGSFIFSQDTDVTVVESAGVLTITPLPSVTGFHYNGYKTIDSYDMTGHTAAVKVTAASGANAETLFWAFVDIHNYMEFSIVDGDLLMRVRQSDVNSNTHLTYNATDHKWLRFSFTGGNILMQTSPDGSTWTTRKTTATALTQVQFGLMAGTFASETPGAAVFDNFSTDVPV